LLFYLVHLISLKISIIIENIADAIIGRRRIVAISNGFIFSQARALSGNFGLFRSEKSVLTVHLLLLRVHIHGVVSDIVHPSGVARYIIQTLKGPHVSEYGIFVE
jgi:hypothetical protein